jgi:polyisoprenoid-binding protein YceI
MAGRNRRARRWVIAGAAVVVILAVGGPFVFIHFIEGPAPAQLTLPKGRGQAAPTAATATAERGAPVAGTWKVGPGSVVGYRVKEVLLGQQATAVGRTTKVWGSVTVSGTSVTKGSFTADMATVMSDQSQRNAQFDGRIMDVSTYPMATFKLTRPLDLGSVPADGAIRHYLAGGDLTMHGVTRPVSFTVSAERSGTQVYVLADIRIVFANWDISNPSMGGFVTTQSFGTLEVLLELTKGAGNPVTTAVPANSGPGGGGPITVPSTTVPPLTVPTS